MFRKTTIVAISIFILVILAFGKTIPPKKSSGKVSLSFDGKKYDFGEWEASLNGTAPAIDMIPRDIIMVPWHYGYKKSYPSIPMFLAKGFRVLPASFSDTSAVKSLIEYSYDFAENKNMLGHLFTTWTVHTIDSLLSFEPIKVGMKTIHKLETETTK